MQIAVISDLHLGAGGPLDGFGHEDSEFLEFLNHLEQNFERIVLLGDIWETLTGKLPGDPGAELRTAQSVHRELAARFRGPRYLQVLGNHDLITGKLDGIPEEITLEVDGVRLLFTHGHQGDPLVADRQSTSELGVWLGGWVRRAGFETVYRAASSLDTLRSGVSEDSTRCAFQKAWMGRAAHRDVDVLVTGHTHLAARAEHGDRLYLNSGSCSDGQMNYLAIDTRLAQYSVESGY
jgi:predicted phosphodiesterase